MSQDLVQWRGFVISDVARSESDNDGDACRPENFRFNGLVQETQRGTNRAATSQRNSTCCVTYLLL